MKQRNSYDAARIARQYQKHHPPCEITYSRLLKAYEEGMNKPGDHRIIGGERNIGKTTALLRVSAKHGIPVLCYDKFEYQYKCELADELAEFTDYFDFAKPIIFMAEDMRESDTHVLVDERWSYAVLVLGKDVPTHCVLSGWTTR